MKYTIEDLRNGKCAVINDGTLEELRDVLKLAFPDDVASLKEWYNSYPCDKLFFARNNGREWYSEKETDLPTQSVKDFLKPSIDDKIKELKELAKSQGMDCDVVLSEKKRIEVTPTESKTDNNGYVSFEFKLSNPNEIFLIINRDVAYFLSKQLENYLNENH